MELSTAQRLAALNQGFYAEHAENFADARPRVAAGAQRVLAGIAPDSRVLEVGCGDGKVGRALARQGVAAYLGLDASEAMLERARKYTTKDVGRMTNEGQQVNWSTSQPVDQLTNYHAERPMTSSVLRPSSFVFTTADLTSPSWPAALPSERFDWALAFAVLHHLPGYALRAGVLRALADHLAPGGRAALSSWVFTRSERLKKRIVPWAQTGLSEADVEPGDYLLSWERKGRRGLRYVHVLDQSEVVRMAAEAGLAIVETFSADGVTGDLSDYVVMAHVHRK